MGLVYHMPMEVLGFFQSRGFLSPLCWLQESQLHVYPNVHCSTVYNSQDMEAT